MVLGLTSVNIHPHKIDLYERDSPQWTQNNSFTFPKISLMLFPEGDMICFRSGDLTRGAVSSSRVAGGLRQDSPPRLLVAPGSPGDWLAEEDLAPALPVSLAAMLPVLVVISSPDLCLPASSSPGAGDLLPSTSRGDTLPELTCRRGGYTKRKF